LALELFVRASQPGDPLTARQKLVFDFVKSRILKGLAPTLREVGAGCFSHCNDGTQVTSSLKCLNAIESKGYIERINNISRGIFLTELGKQ
jgi:hypothetical protein